MDYKTLSDEALLRALDIHLPNGPVPFGRAKWWQLVRAGEAPQPALRTGKVTAWRWDDIRAYLNELADKSPHATPAQQRPRPTSDTGRKHWAHPA